MNFSGVIIAVDFSSDSPPQSDAAKSGNSRRTTPGRSSSLSELKLRDRPPRIGQYYNDYNLNQAIYVLNIL